MSGQAGARGYLIQTLTCVLDSIESEHRWIGVTIEPNDVSEKVDISWQYPESLKVVQVKSSQNQIDLRSVTLWASELEQSVEADAYELQLFGACSASAVEIGNIGKVHIPPPQVLNLKALVEQAAHKLDHYLSNKPHNRTLGPSDREMIVRALCHQLGSYSTYGKLISRDEFDTLLTSWIRDSFKEMPTSQTVSNLPHIDNYLRRFEEFHLSQLPKLIPTPYKSGDVACSSEDLLDFLISRENGQIVGPSGFGKSLLVRHMALSAAKSGLIPIVARANEFSGSLTEILDRAVSAFCPCSIEMLLSAGRDAAHRAVVVMDGLNECPITLQEQLLFDLQAFRLRWQVSVIFTSQTVTNLPPELAAPVMLASELDSTQRKMILQAYHEGELPADAELLCQAFRSGYELSVAATCLDEISDHPNRAGLFDAYVRVRSRGKYDVVILRGVYTAIAGVMRMQFRSNLPISEVERIGQRFLEQQHVSISVLQVLLNAGFLQVTQGKCAFRHELLQHYFEAVNLINCCPNLDDLMVELLKPVHHNLIEFVLGNESDSERFLTLLRGTAGIRAAGDAIADSLQGRYGNSIGAIVKNDIKKLFDAAHEDLSRLEVFVEKSEFRDKRYESLELRGGRQWTSYELELWSTIAQQLSQGIFLDESLHLVSESERILLFKLDQLFGVSAAQKPSIRSQLISDLFVRGTQRNQLPAATLIAGAERFTEKRDSSVAARHLAERCELEPETSYAALYFLLRLTRGRNEVVERNLPNILNRAWNSRIYHLQLAILWYVQLWANPVDEVCSLSTTNRETVKHFLTNLETRDSNLSSTIIETMSSFDLITLSVSVDDICALIDSILRFPDEAMAQEAAEYVISNIFEDIYQDCFYEAIERLEQSHRGKLFSMAALATPHYFMSTTYILEELRINPVPESARAFERFATMAELRSFCPQETAECFIVAHQGSARFCDIPWTLSSVESDDRQAWQCYGEIFFWMAKRDLNGADVKQKSAPTWTSLSGRLRFAAIDPLLHFAETITRGLRDLSEHPVNTLFREFRAEIQELLERGLSEPELLTSIHDRVPSDYLRRQHITFMIHTLGQIGTEATVQMLLPFVNDSYHGSTAIDAIRQLRAGKKNSSLKILRKFP